MSVSFRFIHAADLHLDSPFRGLSKVPSAVRERLRDSTLVAFERLIDAACAEEIDFVVLAGDLYDAADRSLRAQLRMQKAMDRLAAAGKQVFAVHGNHDHAGGRAARLAWPEAVHVFGTDEVGCAPAYTRRGELAAHVYGISYGAASVRDNLALRYARRAGAPFHIALLHANVDGQQGYDNYAPCRLDELVGADFDYWALGHIHDRRVLHEYPFVVYAGNTQGRSIREAGLKGAYKVSVAENGSVELAFFGLSDVLWRTIDVETEKDDSEQRLKDKLVEAAESVRREAEGRPTVVRLRLAGSGALLERLLLDRETELWAAELRDWLGPPDERDDWVWVESIVVVAPRRGLAAEAAGVGGEAEDGFLGELLRLAAAAAADPAASRLLLDEAAEPLRRHHRLRQWLERQGEAERADLIGRAGQLAAALLAEGRE